MKMMTLALILTLFSLLAFCPHERAIYIEQPDPIQPFKPLIFAIGKVECDFDTLAYNSCEQAAGYFQIRPIRVEHYNRLTGEYFTLFDMFDYYKAEKIFLYFADRIGPYDLERVIRGWNGKWELTDNYYAKVRKVLLSL